MYYRLSDRFCFICPLVSCSYVEVPASGFCVVSVDPIVNLLAGIAGLSLKMVLSVPHMGLPVTAYAMTVPRGHHCPSRSGPYGVKSGALTGTE